MSVPQARKEAVEMVTMTLKECLVWNAVLVPLCLAVLLVLKLVERRKDKKNKNKNNSGD